MHVLTVCQVLLHGEAPPILSCVVDVALTGVQLGAVKIFCDTEGVIIGGIPAGKRINSC